MWVLIFGGIALAGLVMVIAYGVWLAHKTSDVLSEVRVLTERSEQIADELGRIGSTHSELTVADGPDPGLDRVR